MKDLTKIKLFAMDVDGTLTDGNIYMGNDGELCKAFNVRTAAKSFTSKNFTRG